MPMLEYGDVPKISIIICTYNRSVLLVKTLQSLLSLENLHQAEIIVVDNHSKDDTASVTKRFMETEGAEMDIRYLLEPVQGLSAARNTGILASKSPIIAFLDDDAIPCRSLDNNDC